MPLVSLLTFICLRCVSNLRSFMCCYVRLPAPANAADRIPMFNKVSCTHNFSFWFL